MAQGLIKAKAKPTTTGGNNSSSSTRASNTTRNGITKKGTLKFNPKKTKLIKAAKINKKFTAGLTAQTEKMLGEKAGHLEMLGQGRKKKNEPKGHAAKRQNLGSSQQQTSVGKKSVKK